MNPDAAKPDPIVLIHGLWVTPRSWEHWITHPAQVGWQEVADDALEWATEKAAAVPV